MAQVVDANRFAQGLTYEEYFATVKNNREGFENYYQRTQLSPEDRAFFAGLGQKKGKIKFLALGEDWCPDVVRGMPIAARIAEACPALELRIFPRDANLDVMNEYLNQGQYQSIPTFVFFDENFNEIGRFIERPAAATELQNKLRAEATKQNLPEAEMRTFMRQKMGEVVDQTIADTISEIREILSK